MEKFILSCGSAVDLSLEHLQKRNIDWIPFTYYIDGVEYKDDFGKTINYSDFYNKIKNGSITKTSQINEYQFIEHYEKYFIDGYDVICVCLSSGISGTYSSALLAKQELESKYPERKLYVIDSLGASSGYGLFVDILADYRDQGLTLKEIVVKSDEIRFEVNHLFFSTDFTTYVRGGRVSKTLGIIGTILKICPILYVNEEGKLLQYKKVRTKNKAIKQIVYEMFLLIDGNKDYDGKCYISHSNCYEDALNVKEEVEKYFPYLKNKVVINSIGTIIGSHSGPGTVALFFIGNKRKLKSV